MEITCKEIIFSEPAVQRLFERGLKAVQVQSIIESGEVIASYPGDQPLPSFLILGWVKERPLHVVLAVDAENQRCQVVTADIPDPALGTAISRPGECHEMCDL